MKIRTYWIHDWFSLKNWNKESLTLLENNWITLAIDCPWHTVQSLHQDTQIISKSTRTKVDFLLITHTDNDHISWLANLIWWKIFWEWSKLNLITHPKIYSDLWEILKRSWFWFDRTKKGLIEKEMSDYCHFFPIWYDEKIHITWFWELESFSRATKHQEWMEVLAWKILDDNWKNVLAFSSDTSFDDELIEFLFSKSWKVLHEVWAYKAWNHSHTDISELLNWVPKSEHNRLFINHIPETREDEILNSIKKFQSAIRFASWI